ncbi:FHA domain-containing protein [Paenibacillus apis]
MDGQDHRLTLKDLGSRNGTVLGEELMAPYNEEYPLSSGDTSLLRRVSMRYGYKVNEEAAFPSTAASFSVNDQL